MTTQAGRILTLLRERGERGATSWELSVDLRALNHTERLSDLRAQGHRIEARREGDHWRYVLRESAAQDRSRWQRTGAAVTLGLVNPTVRVESLRALSERALVDGYGAGAALDCGPVRSEPCACGGTIVAASWEVRAAVMAHQQTPRHAAWRERVGL